MTNAIHSAAQEGFGKAAEVYERARPEYPPQAIDRLVEFFTDGASDHPVRIVDIGAGTGKMTRALAPRLMASGATILAVEPVAAMRETFARILPNVEIRDGTAERLPFEDGELDGIVVAQAFHWFDGARALREFARVLRPGGKLALVWNVRDENEPWVAELTRLYEAFEGDAPRFKSGLWRRAFTVDAPFTEPERQAFANPELGSPERIVERVASISFIAALEEDRRARLLTEVRSLLARHPATRGLGEIEFPYRTEVYTALRQR